MMMTEHEPFMRVAIEMAAQAMAKGNEPFGAILVKDGQILLKAENTIHSDNDVTRHAEMNLVSQASQSLSPDILAQCTLYTSTEPCPMCAGAIYWAGIPRVVYGCSDTILARYSGKEFVVSSRDLFAGSARTPEVIGPILEEEAVKHHQQYWK